MKCSLKDDVTPKGRVKLTVRNPDGSIAQVQNVDNVVVLAGRSVLANALWNPSADVRVSHIELGSGTSTPSASDTDLQTPVYRNTLASGNNVDNVVSLTGYFDLTETSGTYREAGLFIAGDGSLGTGTLLSRVAINITKTTVQTLTIEWEITFN